MNSLNISPEGLSYKNNYLIAFFLLLILVKCFDLIGFTGTPIVLLGLGIMICTYIKSKADVCRNKQLIGILWLMIMGSVCFSFLINKQSFLRVTLESYFAMGLGSFFLFRYLNLSFNNSLKLIKNFSILFCICYIIQWLVYPFNIFSASLDTTTIGADWFRMRMACSTCSYCLYFYGINEYMKNHSFKSLIYMVIGFLPFIIMGFRSLVFLTVIFTIYLLIAYNKTSIMKMFSYFLFWGFASLIVIQTSLFQLKFNEMMDRQESDQTFDNKDYVRYASLSYYSQVFDTPAERFFGGGVPLTSVKKMNWKGRYVSEMNKGYQKNLYWNDLGIIGWGFIFGFPSVALLSFLFLIVVLRCKEKELLFIRVTLLTVYLGSLFTSQELYRSGNLSFLGLLFYAEFVYHKEKRNYRIKEMLNIDFSIQKNENKNSVFCSV